MESKNSGEELFDEVLRQLRLADEKYERDKQQLQRCLLHEDTASLNSRLLNALRYIDFGIALAVAGTFGLCNMVPFILDDYLLAFLAGLGSLFVGLRSLDRGRTAIVATLERAPIDDFVTSTYSGNSR